MKLQTVEIVKISRMPQILIFPRSHCISLVHAPVLLYYYCTPLVPVMCVTFEAPVLWPTTLVHSLTADWLYCTYCRLQALSELSTQRYQRWALNQGSWNRRKGHLITESCCGDSFTEVNERCMECTLIGHVYTVWLLMKKCLHDMTEDTPERLTTLFLSTRRWFWGFVCSQCKCSLVSGEICHKILSALSMI